MTVRTEAEIRELRGAAEIAARRGGEILRQRWSQRRTIDLKGSIDLVTDADRASEEAIVPFLRKTFPDHVVIAEESSEKSTILQGDLRWYVDPLDGTTNYAHRVPHFCVSVGLVGPEGPIAGAVYQPLLDDLYLAGRGLGATLNGAPLQTSACGTLAEALLGTGFPYDIWSHPELPVELFVRALRQARGVRRFGAAALDLAYVASGRFDGYFELGLWPWDIAAGILLVEEAGGVVTDLSGGPVRVDGRQILAANRGVHGELVTLAKPLFSPVRSA